MTSMHSRNVQHNLNFSDLSHFLLTTKTTNLLKASENPELHIQTYKIYFLFF